MTRRVVGKSAYSRICTNRLPQLKPEIVKLPSGDIATIASYANTHADGYYMFVRLNDELTRLKITLADWELQPSAQRLALPYYPAPRTKEELDNIDDFDAWAGEFLNTPAPTLQLLAHNTQVIINFIF